MKTFKEFCDENQYSVHCTRNEAFKIGQISCRAEIDALHGRIDEAINALEQSKPLAMRQDDAKQALDILRSENENQD